MMKKMVKYKKAGHSVNIQRGSDRSVGGNRGSCHSRILRAAPVMAGSAITLFGYLLMGGGVALSGTVAAETTTVTSSDNAISITIPSAVTVDITPSFSGTVFSTAAADVAVTTTNTNGYSLYIGTSGTDSSGNATTALLHKTKSGETMPSITAASTESTFATNAWGYTTDNNGTDTDLGQITAGTYQPLTTTASGSTLIKKTDTTATADTTVVTFAAKADSTLVAGDYTNTVVFSAVANPSESALGIDTMQDMTAEVCAAVDEYETTGETYSLTDTRDGKVYSVRKLADGNCWMVENLALSAESITAYGGSTTLTADDTNTTSSWTIPAASSVGDTWDYETNDAHIIVGSASVAVSGENNNTEDWSAGMGNYYTWGAATAGTASAATSDGDEATASICPKGWQLPNAQDSTVDKSFAKLTAAYDDTIDNLVGSSAAAAFAYSGWYDRDNGYVDYVGLDGFFWSSTAVDSSSAYVLRLFSGGYLDPQYNVNRCYGYSVRCAAQ